MVREVLNGPVQKAVETNAIVGIERYCRYGGLMALLKSDTKKNLKIWLQNTTQRVREYTKPRRLCSLVLPQKNSAQNNIRMYCLELNPALSPTPVVCPEYISEVLYDIVS